MKQIIKTLAITLALSSLSYAADATLTAPDADPAARLQRVIREAQEEATRIASRTKEQREAGHRAQAAADVTKFAAPAIDIDVRSKNGLALKVLAQVYKNLLFSIDDRTEQLTAELDFMRRVLRESYTQQCDASRDATTALTAKDSSIASLTQANTEKDAEIAALKAQLAVEKAAVAEHKMWRGLIMKTQELLAAENAYMTNLRQAPNPLDAEGGDAE